MSAPMRVSVIIPTHNRRAMLERTIATLAAQRYPLDAIEVIVVADGCTDATDRLTFDPPLAGRVIAQPAGGPAAARNRGAAEATGDLLLFVDDDVEMAPQLVEAHVRAHLAASARTIVVGYLPPKLNGRRDLFGITLRGWWETMFERMRQPGHRFTYADVLTGNCSVPATLFGAVGGFDEQLRCHEDFEFGYRAIRAGGGVTFAPDAAGWHCERTDLGRALARKRAEGIADVALARKHPELWPVLPCAADLRVPTRRSRLLRKLAKTAPAVGDVIERVCRTYLRGLGRLRARDRWRTLIEDLLWYWYWRGIAEALGGTSFAAFRDSIHAQEPATPDLPEIDLRGGLSAAAAEIDHLRPAGVTLRYGPVRVGRIPIQPWAEPLAGRHLRQMLKTRFGRRLMEALAIVHAMDPPAETLAHLRVLVSDAAAVFDDRSA